MRNIFLFAIFAMVVCSGCNRNVSESPVNPPPPTSDSQKQENIMATSGVNHTALTEHRQGDTKQIKKSSFPIGGIYNVPCNAKNANCDSLIQEMISFYPPLNSFELIANAEISPSYIAIVLRGTGPASEPISNHPSESFWKSESFGVFIVDPTGKHVLTLDIFPTGRMNDYSVKLVEHGDGYLVISGSGSTYGDGEMKRKYFFDIGDRKLLSTFSGGVDVNMTHIIELGDAIYCIGNIDRDATVITKITLSQSAQYKIEFVTTIQNEKIEKIVDAQKIGDKLLLTGSHYQYQLSNNVWEKSKIANPEAKQHLIEIKLDGKMYRFRVGEGADNTKGWAISGFYEAQVKPETFYSLPQPSYELFRNFRPERVRDGYTEDGTHFDNAIGPHQIIGNKIWFGMMFYDGEGDSGVGGIGYFDILSKKYEVAYRKDIADASIYSMLIEPDLIWLGLGGQPEGEIYSLGMAKINRKDNSMLRYDVPSLVNSIVRLGKSVYAATSDGLVVFYDSGSIETIKPSLNKDGSYSAMINKKASIEIRK